MATNDNSFVWSSGASQGSDSNGTFTVSATATRLFGGPISGNGGGLTNLSGANVGGAVAAATYSGTAGSVTGTVAAVQISGTLAPATVTASTLTANSFLRVSGDGLSLVTSSGLPETNLFNGLIQLYPTLATNYTMDCSLGSAFFIYATNNIFFLTPNNLLAGKPLAVWILQDGTGTRTVTWTNTFKFSGGIAPSNTTNANAYDLFSMQVLPYGTNIAVVGSPNFK